MYAIPTGITLIKFRTTLIRGTGRSKDMGNLQGRRKMKKKKNGVQIKLGGNPHTFWPPLYALSVKKKKLQIKLCGNPHTFYFWPPPYAVSLHRLSIYLFNRIKNMTTDFTSDFTECV